MSDVGLNYAFGAATGLRRYMRRFSLCFQGGDCDVWLSSFVSGRHLRTDVRPDERSDRNISELKRAQCIYFRSEHGLPPQQIADMVGFDVGTVRNLHSAFLRDGEAALKLSGKGGRYHAYLTEEEEASWLEGFRDAGENGGILEVGRIQAAFEEKVGRKVAKSTVYDLLHRHGWRKITPRPRHPKSDPDAAASFKKTSATS